MNRPLRILACHRFFWPDTPPYASILRLLCAGWAQDGHDVSVFSTQPSYKQNLTFDRQASKEQMDGYLVRRIWVPFTNRRGNFARALQATWFSAAFFFRVLFGAKPDVVMSSTFPPVLLGFLACVAARVRRATFIYHCMDIHPEVTAVMSGRDRGPMFRMLQRVDGWTCAHSIPVVLSGDMARTLHERPNAGSADAFVINNFDMPVFDQVEEHDRPFAKPTRFRLSFVGNIGRFQGLEKLLDALTLIDDPASIEVYLVGEGVAKNRLVNICSAKGLSNVHFVSHVVPSVARLMMEESDLGLVSLIPGMSKVAFPSKTMSYLAAGCPILAVVEAGSDLANLVETNDIGYVVEPGDVAGLALTLQQAITAGRASNDMRRRCRELWNRDFSYNAVRVQWCELLETIAGTSVR